MFKFQINPESNKYLIGLRALSKYNNLAYKQLFFDIYPKLKLGEFIGESKDNINYKVKLQCDKKFIKVHGQIYLEYHVDYEDYSVTLDSLEPYEKLLEFYRKYVKVFNGIPITNEVDFFKANLSKILEEHQNENK